MAVDRPFRSYHRKLQEEYDELRSVVLVVSHAEPFFKGDPAAISVPETAGELNDMSVLGVALTAAVMCLAVERL